MSHHEGPGCGCSSCLEMYPAPEPCKNCNRLLDELETLKDDMTRLVRENGLLNQSRAERAEADLAALRQRHADLRALLAPVCDEETIEGAIRNLQQALLSEQGNVATLEQRHAEAVHEAWAEAVLSSCQSVDAVSLGLKAWDHSEAKARLT